MNEQEYNLYIIAKESYKQGSNHMLNTISKYISELADKHPEHRYFLRGLALGMNGDDFREEIERVADRHGKRFIENMKKNEDTSSSTIKPR